MSEVKKFSLIEELRKADNTLQGSPSLLGMTMLTYPNYINSMRSTMFTSHLKQFLNLLEPEFPAVFTNNENIVGKYSSGYKKANADLTVYRKIAKYDDIIDTPRMYKLFVFDKESKIYDVIERKVCEDLTENFGYDYINDVIDTFKEGDTITRDTVMYRSTSYDEDMNYAYGRNVTVAYTLDPFTSEDAAVASKSLCEKFTSIETETFKIGLNSNDFLINMYGNKHNYKPLPDIGEVVSNKLAVSRRQFNNQLFFDFKDSSLREIHEGDSIYYIDKNVEIVDYTIYNNNEEDIDNPFYEQILKYIRSQEKYYNDIIDTCEEIFESGYQYTREIDYLYKRATEMIDRNKKWKDGDNVFNNMEIEVTVRRRVPLAKGCKLTGRFGNKSVISEIRNDEDMPYTHDGRRVDLLLSLLAIINRTTSFPLFELFITGAGYQVRQQMKTMSTIEEKENTLFTFIRILNEKQADRMFNSYSKLSLPDKTEYIQNAIDEGILIHQTPLWEDMPIFYRCMNLLKEFPFIKMDDLYVKKWGREQKCLTKYFIGTMYCLKLKQSDRRGFSARSTGALDTKSLPTRSFKSKSHLERISSSCIRFGEFESLNFSIGILPEDIALFHALYRTSIKGRRDIVSMMFGDEGIKKIDSSYTSRVAEVFTVILKQLGISLEFEDDDNKVKVLDDDILRSHTLNGEVYFCTDYQFFLIQRTNEIKNEILEKNPVITETKLREMIDYELKHRKYLNGPLNEELGDLSKRVEEEISLSASQQREQREKYEEKIKTEENIGPGIVINKNIRVDKLIYQCSDNDFVYACTNLDTGASSMHKLSELKSVSNPKTSDIPDIKKENEKWT